MTSSIESKILTTLVNNSQLL